VSGATTCRSCNAPIVFARSSATGKLMPFERDAAGEWTVELGVATHVGKAPATPIEGVPTVARWTSHFARCAHAESWRRPR
jgi:hypothetical protein